MADTQEDIKEFQGSNIQELIGKYLPYWPVLILLMGIGALIAYLQLRSAVPVYQANASIMIKINEQQGNIVQQLGGVRNGGFVSMDNEIALLKSSPIAIDVVKELHLYAPITQEGRVRKNQSAYATSPVVFRMQSPDSLLPANQVPFKYNPSTNTVTFGNVNYPLNHYVNTPYGTMMIIRNPYAGPELVQLPMFFSLVPVGVMAGQIQGSLGVTNPNPETSLLSLSYTDQSPERAQHILNAVVKAYNQAAIDEKNKLSANTLKFLDERVKIVEQDLDSIQRKLQSFRAANKIVDVSAQGGQYLSKLNANDQKITDINLQLTVLGEVEQYITSKQKNRDILVPAIGSISDPILSGQIQRLYTAESQQAALSATTGSDFPALKTLTNEISSIRPTLLENIRNQRQNLLATRSDLTALNNDVNTQLSALPAQERELLDITRQQQIRNTIYTFLLQRREETALTYASTVADTRVVNNAQVMGIVSPNARNTYTQWIVAGAILSILFIFIRENLNRNVMSRPELEKLTVAPIIADIAYNKASEAIVVEAGSRSLIAEQFRYLRTSLNYIGINASHKKILFTSSISGEGKSFITTNLAATLALTGKKVVMLELDLRKPKLSDMMGLDRNVGLSDYFIGNKIITEIIKSSTVPNLFLISSGAIPPNPAELLMNGRLPELLLELEARFDHILIDTAPISPVTDAYIISPMCDATLYVVRQGVTPRFLVQKLNDILRSKRLKNLSLVFNGVKQKRFGSYYGYGYGYGYTYGYGYLDDKKGKKKKKNSTGTV